jgi:hypothetical protein
MTKQSGHAVSKTDIDDYDNSNRTYQFKATLLHELISVDISWIQFHIIKIPAVFAYYLCVAFCRLQNLQSN